MDGGRDILEEIDMEIENLDVGVRNVAVNEVVQNQIPQGPPNNIQVNQGQPVVGNIVVAPANYNNVHQDVGNEGAPVNAENEENQAALVPGVNEDLEALENQNAPGNVDQNQNVENNNVVEKKPRGTRAGWQKKFYYRVKPYDKGQHKRLASLLSELANMDQPYNSRQNEGNYNRRGGAQGGRGNNGAADHGNAAGLDNGRNRDGNGVAQGGRGNNAGGRGNNAAGRGNGARLGNGGHGNNPNYGNHGVAPDNDGVLGNGGVPDNDVARGGHGRGQQ